MLVGLTAASPAHRMGNHRVLCLILHLCPCLVPGPSPTCAPTLCPRAVPGVCAAAVLGASRNPAPRGGCPRLAGLIILVPLLVWGHWDSTSLSSPDPHPTGRSPDQASSISTRSCTESPDTWWTMGPPSQSPAPTPHSAATWMPLNLGPLPDPNPSSLTWTYIPTKGSPDQQECPRPLPTFIRALHGCKTQSRATIEHQSQHRLPWFT